MAAEMTDASGELGGRLAERWQVRRLLATGGQGAVYEAWDELLGELVAVKVVSLRADEVRLLKREFRLLESVRHANVVRARELVVADELALVSMDLVRGVPVDRYVAASRGQPEFLSTVRHCMRGLLHALKALHTHGITHRDVKPANVLVDVHGEVVLVDLGLARDVSYSDQRPPSGLVGTVGYIAPEQLWATEVSPAADLFAAGAILLELLNGASPKAAEPGRFRSGLPEESLRDAQAVCPELATLSERLLAPDPAQRPDLESALSALGESPAPRVGPVHGFVGRDAEVAVLESSAHRSVREARIALVRGDSGMGKSTLVNQVLRMLGQRGTQVFRHRCHPSESVSFQAIDGVVEAVAAALPAEERPPAEANSFAALVRAFPALTGVMGAPSAAIGDLRASPDALEEAGRGLARLLTALTAKSPVCVWLDDLQWADPDSVHIVRAALRHSGPGVWWVLSTRNTPERGVQLTAELTAGLEVDEVSLSTLPPETCLAWARRVAPDRAEASLAELVRTSQGWPLYLTELLSTPEEVAEGQVSGLLRRRVGSLSERARRILRLVCLAPGALDVELLARLMGGAPGAELTHLIDDRFLSWGSGGKGPLLTPYHDAVREVVEAELDAPSRLALYRDLLAAYRDSAPAGVLFHLCRGAELLDEARGHGLQALRDALSAYAYDRAVVLANDLSSMPGIDAHRFEVSRGRAIGLLGTGRGREAAAEFLEAAKLAPDELQELLMRRRAAEELLGSGEYREGLEVLGPLLDAHRVPRPRSGMAGLMTVLGLQGKVQRERRRAPASVVSDARSEERLRFLWGAGAGVGLSDSIAAFQLQFRHALAAEASGSEAHRAMALVTESVNHHWEGGAKKLAEGARVLAEGRRLAERSGSPLALAQTRLTEVIRLFLGRHFTEALEAARQGERFCLDACPESPWHLASFRWFIAHSLPMELRFEEARRWLPERLRLAVEHSDQYLLLNLRVGRPNLVHLAAGSVDVCREGLDWVKANCGASPYFYYAWVLGSLWLELYQGRPKAALDLIDDTFPELKRRFVFRMQPFRIEFGELEVLTLAALAAKEGASPALTRRARKRLGQLRTEDALWIPPYLERLEAALALLEGRQGAVVEHTERARVGFDQLGIKLHAALARGALDAGPGLEELRAAGIEEPRRFARIWHPWLSA